MMFRTACLIAVGVLVVFRCSPASKHAVNSTRSLLTTEKRPVIYTYNDESEEEEEIIKVWEKKWYDAGWNPIVLTMENAKAHLGYQDVLESLPKGAGARALHWLSVAQVGGGWFSEHGVFPLHKCTNEITLNGGNLTVWENVVPSLVSGSSAEFARGAQLLAETSRGDDKHSDILALVQLSRNNHFENTFLQERKVISGSRATDVNISNCFEGKLAVHFNTYTKSDDIKSIVHWLDSWARSKCCDLPKPPMTTVVTPPNHEDNSFSSGLGNQKLEAAEDRNAPIEEDHQGPLQPGAHTRLQPPQAGQLIPFVRDTVMNEGQSQTFGSHPQPSRTYSLSTSQGSASRVVPASNLPFRQHVGDAQLRNTAHITQALLDLDVAEQNRRLPVQLHATGTLPTVNQLRYLQVELFEEEIAKEGDAVTNQDALSLEDQVRQLRMRLPDSLKALEWSQLLKAASIDENLVHQLAKGDRRPMSEMNGQESEQRNDAVEQGTGQNKVLKEFEGQDSASGGAPQPGS